MNSGFRHSDAKRDGRQVRLRRTLGPGLVLATLVCAVGMAVGLAGRPGRIVDRPGLVAQVQPARVVAGAWTRLTLTVSGGARGIHNGVITVSAPSGWPAPSARPASAGYVTASAGIVASAGRSALVRKVDLAPRAVLTITYGGGRAGATEPTVSGIYNFRVRVASGRRSNSASITRSLVVRVQPPRYGCQTAIDPVDAGPSLALPNGIARSNVYNAAGSSGVVRECYGRSGAVARIRLKAASPTGPGPLGYPEVAYGYHLFDQPFCRTCHSQPFPLPVSTLRRFPKIFRVSTTYSVGDASPESLPRDFIYDLWLERNPAPGREPRPGDLELALFLYRGSDTGPCVPDALRSTLTATALVNGRSVSTHWTVCRFLGGTAATPVAFLLTYPAESRTASISLPIAPFIDSAGQFAGEDVSEHSLMGIELGGEFDQCSGPSGCIASALNWSWHISRLIFEAPTGVVPIVFPATR
jgi:hypothetical protein